LDLISGGRLMDAEETFVLMNELEPFKKVVAEKSGGSIDLDSIIQLNSDFVDAGDDYLLLNIKGYDASEPNNLVLLTDGKPIIYSKTPLSRQEVNSFGKILLKPTGINTVIVFLMLNKTLAGCTAQLEKLTLRTAELESNFDHAAYRDVAHEFDRLADRLDEFHQLLLRLQERKYKEIESQYISFDYRVMLSESSTLQSRCRRRENSLKELRQEHESRATEDLNQKIVGLNEVVKRLTAITVILMLPTLIASHFGMNFVHMPELKLAWAYPAVIGLQLVLMLIAIVLFRKYKWL
jgi:hypothetical protein